MPLVSRVLPDGSVEEFFYEDPPAPGGGVDHVNEEHPTKHESVDVDNGAIKLDGDLNTPLVITKDLQSADKYITCKTAANAEQFTVSGVGEVRCQDVGCTDIEVTDALHVGQQFSVGDTVIKDDGMHIHKNIVMSVKPGSNDAPPSLFTSGSVVAVKDGLLGFVPYDEQGNQIPGHVYRLGRQENIGDLTHDNDGLNMRKTSSEPNGTVLPHRVHVCPDATDPNLLVCSKKDTTGFFDGDYVQFRNVGPNEAPTEENVVFRVDAGGDIISNQIEDIEEYLEDHVNRLYNIDEEIEEIKGVVPVANGNSTDIDTLFTNLGLHTQDIATLFTTNTAQDQSISALTTSVATNTSDISTISANNNSQQTAISSLSSSVTANSLAVATNSNDITVLQNASSGGGLEAYDITTHDSKNIGLYGDYTPTNLSWGSYNDIRTVPWGTNPTSLTCYVRKSGSVYLPNPNNVNLTPGEVVTFIFVPRSGQNCMLTVYVHSNTEAWMSWHNNTQAKYSYPMHENRTAKFIYLGVGHNEVNQNLENRHRWVLEYID